MQQHAKKLRSEIPQKTVDDEALFSLEEIYRDPRFFLWRIDVSQKKLHFLKVSPSTLYESTFLDHRIAHSCRQILTVHDDAIG